MMPILSLCKVAFAGLSAMCLAVTAQAETLQIEDLYPARAPDIALIKSISIDRFGGQDGTALAFEIEDKLSDVEIQETSYFKIMAGRSAVDPEATLSGTATTGVEEYEVSEYRDRCIERNEKGKCEKRKSIKVACLKRVIDFQAQVRLSRFSDGRTIYAERKSDSNEQTVCGRKESFASSEKVIRGMINSAAYSVRLDLAPIERRENIRVLESRKGMDKTAGSFFKAAVKMTKNNAEEACRMWDDANLKGPAHVSVIFNLGLCAEQEGHLDVARDYFTGAQRMASNKVEIGQALSRIADKQRARDDWYLRLGIDASGEDGAEATAATY